MKLTIRNRWLRRALTWACPVALIGLLVWHWPTFDTGADALAHADRNWLMIAGASVALMWLAGSCCQLGSTTILVPLPRLIAVQVAGSFANHLLPAGVGGTSLNLRMFRRSGLARGDAAAAVTLNTVAGAIVHVLALVALVIAIPSSNPLGPRGLAAVLSAATLVGVGTVLAARPIVRRWARGHPAIRQLLEHTATALRRPSRAVLLWGGSVALPLLHIVTLVAVFHALGSDAPAGVIALAYLGASALSAVVPTPGGFGGLDLALTAALTGAGIAPTTAVAAVIGYRLLTVWIPMIPAAATLAVLVHRKAV